MEQSRRQLLGGAALTLARVTRGAVTGTRSLAASSRSAARSGDPHDVTFAWDISNLDNNGADVWFEVLTSVTLVSVNIDVAFLPSSGNNDNNAEILCTALVSRNGVPGTSMTAPEYLTYTASSDFGLGTYYNPNNLNPSHGAGNMLQDFFYGVILKTWVPSGGEASATSRQFRSNLSLALNAGNYVAFHMDHLGVSGDAQMQVCLTYM